MTLTEIEMAAKDFVNGKLDLATLFVKDMSKEELLDFLEWLEDYFATEERRAFLVMDVKRMLGIKFLPRNQWREKL